MSMTVIGIDPSLRRTGLARVTLIDAAGRTPTRAHRMVETTALQSTGHLADSLTTRCTRLVGIAAEVMCWATPLPQLAVIEGPSYGSVGGLAWDRAGLWWRIVMRLLGSKVPVAIVPPPTRAKWATGSGAAGKTAVHEAITALWSPYWPNHPADDNEADALVLASMGAQWLGRLPVPGPDTLALAGAAWPRRSEVLA